MSRPSLRPRPQRSVPAILVALVLLAIAVLTVWTSAQRLVSGSWPQWWSALAPATGASWGMPVVLAVSAGVALVGLVLLLAAVIPGARSALTLAGGDAQHELVVTRSGLARLVTTAAAQVSGVEGVRTTVDARRVSVRVATPSAQIEDVRRRVADGVRMRIDSLGVQPAPRVVVVAHSTTQTNDGRTR